ncbi:MAG: hypothetical protein ABSG68_02310 [Thermoguttaceae bacterium]
MARQSFAYSLKRRWPLALIAFAATFAGVCAFTAMRSPKYRSEAKLYIRLGRETAAVDPMTATGQFGTTSDPRVFEINSIVDLLTSQDLRQQVVADIGSDRILGPAESAGPDLDGRLSFLNQFHLNPFHCYSREEDAMERLHDLLRVAATKTSSIISLRCDASSPDLARDVLQAMIKAAQDKHLRTKQTEGSDKFFGEQVEQSRRALRSAEEALRNYRITTGLVDFALQQRICQEQIAAINQDRRSTDVSLTSARAEVAVCQNMLADTPRMVVVEQTTGQPNTAKDGMRGQLYALELKEKELRTKYQLDTFFVQQIDNQINQARDTLAREPQQTQVRQAMNAVYDLLAARLSQQQVAASTLDLRSKKLDEQLAQAQKQAGLLAQQQTQLAELERSVALAEDQFRTYARSHEQVRADAAMELGKISNINVAQQPTFAVTPVRPNPRTDLPTAAVLALCAAALVGIRRPKTASAVQVLDVPVERFHRDPPPVKLPVRRGERVRS